MSFRKNETQQLSLEDSFDTASDRMKSFVLKSWAKDFGEIVFPAINEERFAILYSENNNSRPNAPVNVLIGALILKALHQLTDEELVDALVCGDLRYQYALRTTSFPEQPISKNSFNRFRTLLYHHYLDTGVDLLHEEMEALAEIFADYLNIRPTMQRMDSVMIAANCRKYTRLELIYVCVRNIVKTVFATGEGLMLKGLEHYLKDADANQLIYHDKETETAEKIERLLVDAAFLKDSLGGAYYELQDYQMLCRLLSEQTVINDIGELVQKPNKNLEAASLQNPNEPEATYRKKAGKGYFGYVGHVVETVDKTGSMITQYNYAPNSHSDVKFGAETIKKLGLCDERVTLVADGAYDSIANREQASKQNIDFLPTNLTGAKPDPFISGFKITEGGELICPADQLAKKTTFQKTVGRYSGWFDKEYCLQCPLLSQCKPKMRRTGAVLEILPNTLFRAYYLLKIQSAEFKQYTEFRNGVEAIPSLLRRKYRIDYLPVRGFVRSKIFFSLSVGAINVKKLIKGNKKKLEKENIWIKFRINLFFSKSQSIYGIKNYICII